jgi:type I restriction enzyme S subunit
MERIRSTLMIVPPISIQHAFAECLTQEEQIRTSYKASMKELETLFASFQHRAFRGDLRWAESSRLTA